ncbi:hypothetical protein A9C19_00680 [Bacillus weihaiensis]|uniref:Uncharacterized protein n=1 Tax=Bacillus weihaiensis TaxID=1547283 RepID=A0A1L3MM30_9BACI|nr:hypothetical protein A9C19_00680 [Bacillus weihaiensis]
MLKYLDKLPHTKKEQVYQWVKRYVEPTSSVGGRFQPQVYVSVGTFDFDSIETNTTFNRINDKIDIRS